MQYAPSANGLVVTEERAPAVTETAKRLPQQGILRYLPVGLPLSDEIWNRRHRVMVALVWLHAIVMPIAGLFSGNSPAIESGLGAEFASWLGFGAGLGYGLIEGAIIALFGLIAAQPRGGRRLRAAATSMGLLTGSAAMVHLSGGFIEFHFHYFVVVALVALYQDWTPFLVAVGYVALQHGVFGALNPAIVYNHPEGVAHPWKWAAIHAGFVLFEAAAILTGWRLVEEEMTRRRSAEKHVEQARVEQLSSDLGHLTETDRAKSTMLATISNGLRKPMADILGQSRVMLAENDGNLTTQQESDVLQITESAEQMIGLIDNVLDFSRLETGWRGDSPEEVELFPVVAGIRDSYQLLAQKKHIELSVNVPDGLPPVWVDPAQLDRMLTILVDNAVNYTSSGRVAITARLAGGDIQIAVSDTGVGIPPEAIDIIFEPYRRSDVGSNRRTGGVGLGLAVAKRMAALQGGVIQVSSRLGAGSTFWLTLPAAGAVPDASPVLESRGDSELVAVGAAPVRQQPETRVIEYPRLR